MQLKKMSVIVTITLIIAIAAALSGCTNTASPTAAPAGGDLKAGLPASLDYSIQVTGGATPVTLSYADLKGMEFKELKGASTVNSVGTPTAGDYIGVPLIDIVTKAGLPSGEVSFKVTAVDGYDVEYSMAQLTAGILALKADGKALTNNFNDVNCIHIVVDKEPKNMWLKMPVTFEIKGGAAKAVALAVSGENVTTKKNYALDELKNMTQMTITTTGKNNTTRTYTGVSLIALLDAAGPKGEYVKFSSGDADDYNQTIKISDIYASPDAIISIGANGQLKNIITGQPSSTWVGNLTKIRID